MKVLEIYKQRRKKISYKFDLGFQNQINYFLSELPEIKFHENLLDEINTMELVFNLVDELSN